MCAQVKSYVMVSVITVSVDRGNSTYMMYTAYFAVIPKMLKNILKICIALFMLRELKLMDVTRR